MRLDGKRNTSIASQLGYFQMNLLSMMCSPSPSCRTKFVLDWIGHVNNIPTMRFFNGISRNTYSKSYMLSLTEWVQAFQCNALWDTHQHALFVGILIVIKLRQQTPTHGSNFRVRVYKISVYSTHCAGSSGTSSIRHFSSTTSSKTDEKQH